MTMFEAKIPPQFKDSPEHVAESFRKNGYHIECGIWSDEECATLIEAAEASRETITDGRMILDQIHKTDDRFLAAMRKRLVVDVIESIFEEEASGIQSGFFFCPSRTPGFLAHQDNIFVDTDPDAFILAWTALCDVEPHNGCLYLYPGTHREHILPLRAVDGRTKPGSEPDAYTGESVVPAKYEPVAAVIPRGSTVFLHGHMVHGSNGNESESCRYAMFHSYVKRGANFSRGNRVQREEVCLLPG